MCSVYAKSSSSVFWWKIKLDHHIKEVIAGSNKSVGTIRKFSNVFTKDSLVAIAKTFVRPHFDNSDIVQDQPNNENFGNLIST